MISDANRSQWTFPDGVTYLNHGSFGPSPEIVRRAKEVLSRELELNPMDFLTRQLEDRLDGALDKLATFVGCDGRDLAFVDNATSGMNVVAQSIPLKTGDEVLFTDHEYGAVMRIWRETCQKAGARVVVQPLPFPISSADELVAQFFSGVTQKTKLIVVSHITSPTAVKLPVKDICAEARRRGILTCIDGPHAIAMMPLNLNEIDADFYSASCHKWLAAPFGSGFLYVKRKHQQALKPAVISWGGSLAGKPFRWLDELHWSGTRDPAAWLSVPVAIQFLEDLGVEKFRTTTHELARYARQQINSSFGADTFYPDSLDWYGSMIAMPLPAAVPVPSQWGGPHELQKRLWERHKIEVPVMKWHEQLYLRVSCYLYNTREDIDRLVAALGEELKAWS